MNRISRLTALLLALMMIFSTFAAAETAYSVGGMTVEQWGQLVDQAEDELYTVDEGDAGKTITPESPEQAERGDYYPYSDGVTAALADENVTCQISASGVAILTNSSAGQWQMKIGSTWVNITGETGSTLSVTGAMMNGMTAAEVRKALGARDAITGEYAAYTAVATVEIVEMSPVMLFGMSRADTSSAQTGTGDSAAPFSLQRANDGTTYTVIIDYVFTDGTTAAASWGASLGAGTSLNQVVTNPMVVGYKPASVVINPTGAEGVTYTPATVAAADDAVNDVKIGDVTAPGSVNLAISAIDQHITVTVTYEPTLVDYTVIHKQQNTDNDNYTEVERVTERGLTGTVVPDKDIARSYPGFYNLLYEQPTIAANGSTVVEISYDRYYYLINFELFGGYGVDPVYGRFGAAVGEVGTPVRAGYTFKGWATTKEKAEAGTVDVTSLPTTIPYEHTTYYAVWEMAEEAKVSVVFWGENPNDEEYSYIQTGEVIVKPGEDYTYEDGDPVYMLCDLEEHTHGVDCQLKCGKEEHTSHTEQCIACGKPMHTHNVTCYAEDGAAFAASTSEWYVRGTETNGHIGQSYIGIGSNLEIGTGKKYIYIDGTWYRYTGNAAVGGKIEAGCETEEHTHDNTCYGCEVHTHTEACYDCGKEEHTHDNSCNQEMDGLDSKLWTFVRSETVEVAADGSSVVNVYYDRTEFTMTFKEEGNNGDTLGTIKDKWGANIKSRFETISKNNTYFWSTSSNGGDPWTSFMDIMPQENRTYYADPQSGSTQLTATYYTQNVSGTAYDVAYTVSFKGDSGINVSKEEFVDIEGFTFNDGLSTDTGENYNGSKFYYDRNKYCIEFYNPVELIKKSEPIYYGASIENQYFVPGDEWAPDQYEPGSVEFAGWYLNPECTGEEYDFTGKTMPVAAGAANNATTLTVYAKWVPVTYKVRFFLNEDLMKTGLDSNVYTPNMALGDEGVASFTVNHGAQIPQTFVDAHLDYNAMRDKDQLFHPYTFVAWFYYDEAGVKHPFEPKTQIKQNMDVFAEWSSDVLVPYTVRYAVPKKNADGSYVLDENNNRVVDYYVAAETTGSALAGTSKTFEAKGGADLYADYQTGCFPETESHTLRFETEDAAAGVEYIFWYTDEVKVPYKVFYVTAQQNDDNSLTVETIPGVTGTYYRLEAPKSVDDNENAVVTETFKTISGYMPDAYQKRLIVTNDGNPDNDVIIFIYTKDEQHAYYRVTHYIENLDTDSAGNTTWTEYTSSQFIGDIGKTTEYNNDPLTISGFAYSTQEYVVKDVVTQGDPDNKATLTADGMQINLYYVRKEYPYKVQYLLENTTTELAPEKIGKAKYEKTVVEDALDITNYELVSTDPQSLTIRIEEDPNGDPTLNIITFYYREKTGEINYQAVCPDNPAAQNFGSVTPETEELSILSGVAKGSTAAAGENYTFVGWYDNEACSGEALTTEAKYVPTKADGTVWPESTTYYAKFEENEVTLNYAVVTGCDAMGTVAPTEETLKVLSGKAAGSTATAGENYKFVGWYDNEAGNGTAVATTEQFVPTKGENEAWPDDKTWYAKFEEKQATITYVAVGNGTVDPVSETLNVVTGVAKGSTATADVNHHFVGWYTDADCKTPVNPSWVETGKITPVKADGTVWPESTTYYAKFEENEVTINYVAALRVDDTVTAPSDIGGLVDLNDSDDAGAITTFETVKVSTGTAVGATAEPNANYKFVGWYDNAECSGEALSTDAAYVPDKSDGLNTAATYYALFEEKQATITYVAVGNGTVDPVSETLNVVTGVAKGSTATADVNHHFVGWYTDADCKNPVNPSWVENGKITPVKADGTVWPESTTYYAKFEENEVTINYVAALRADDTVTAPSDIGGLVDLNDGADAGEITTLETVKVSTGTAVGATAEPNANYKFVGWYDNAECSGEALSTDAAYVPGKSDGLNTAATYYALFEEKQATITYVAVGNGTVDPVSETLNVVTGVAKGSTATADVNHHFVGWYTDEECKNPVNPSWVETGKITPVKADGTVWPESTTYYAKFEEDEVTINYVAALRADGTVTVENGTGGLVDLNDGDDAGAITTLETVKVSTGTAVGATAEPNANYKFVGWYDNAECSGEALSTDAAYVPGKSDGLNTAATYYALFELDVADLVIIKTVNGEANPPTDPFELTITLPDGTYTYTSKLNNVTSEGTLTVSGGKGTLTIRDGEEITIHDVVIGSEYAVTEKDLPWFAENVSATGTQIAANGNQVSLTNTYMTGTLTVSKRVEVQAGIAAPSADTEFDFEVELTDAPLGSTVSVRIDNAAPQSLPLNDGKVTFKLKNGQTAMIYDLPVGTTYVVTEVNVPDNFIAQYDDNRSGAIIDGNTATLVINNYPERYADLTVTKNGLQASKESAIIEVVVTTNNASTTYTLVLNQANPSATITRIPVGSNYTVTERDAWTWGYKDTTAQTGAIVDGGSMVNITNAAEGDKWMHDESYLVNNIQTGGSAGVNN